ncbi:MAG: hypothetical protein JWQ29_1873 [Phenylobacterium sp.]|nr:hypothetical protein [Phenylobacterium sp.]
MLSLRAHLIIAASLFAAILLMAGLAGALEAAGIVKDPAVLRIPAMVVGGGLFLAFGFSCVPVMVKLVLGAQRRLGNDAVPAIRSALAAETVIIWAIWALMAAGLAIAIPAAIADGAFGPGPGRALHAYAGKSAGVLAVRPGMSVAEMVAGSTLKLRAPPDAPVYAGGEVFEYRIPGSALSFPGARYFYVSTFTRDPSRVEAVSVGTSHDKLTRAEHEAADADLRRRLAADGWLAGHEAYRDEEDRQLHGGATRGPAGRVWLKDGVVLSIESTKVDEPPPGADPEAAPVWIQAISLWGAKDYSGFERWVFEPAA